MRVSVVVSTFNRREIVLRTVQTLIDQDFPPEQYEIIVVVDGSKDGSTAALRALQARGSFRVLEQENRGLAGARNTGWQSAEHDLIIFLDDDMLCDRSLVRAHFDVHTESAAAIGVGAVLLNPSGPRTVARECFNREVGAYALRGIADLKPLPLSACIFGNTSLRKRWLEESGGFDERYRMREDAEFAVRLAGLGVQPIFARRAIAHQIYNKTAADLVHDSEAFAEADAQLLRHHPEAAELTFAGKIGCERGWKRGARRLAASVPALSDFLAAPLRWLGDRFSGHPQVLDLGVRALQVQRGMHYYRRVLEIERRSAPGTGERK